MITRKGFAPYSLGFSIALFPFFAHDCLFFNLNSAWREIWKDSLLNELSRATNFEGNIFNLEMYAKKEILKIPGVFLMSQKISRRLILCSKRI